MFVLLKHAAQDRLIKFERALALILSLLLKVGGVTEVRFCWTQLHHGVEGGLRKRVCVEKSVRKK